MNVSAHHTINENIHIIHHIPIADATKHEYMASFNLTDNSFSNSVKHYITTGRNHPTLGLSLHIDPDNKIILFKIATPPTP